ncbi:MAG: AbrB family transcriptional regulator, partial [Xanthobacteraceae bacterium]
VVIAFAPGAQDTMMVLALALHLDPVYVGAHHLARFLVVTVAIAVAARRVARQGSASADGNRSSGTPNVEN